jgi:hypothetical protein
MQVCSISVLPTALCDEEFASPPEPSCNSGCLVPRIEERRVWRCALLQLVLRARPIAIVGSAIT